jgi:hypothetical protein
LAGRPVSDLKLPDESPRAAAKSQQVSPPPQSLNSNLVQIVPALGLQHRMFRELLSLDPFKVASQGCGAPLTRRRDNAGSEPVGSEPARTRRMYRNSSTFLRRKKT